MKAGVLLFTLLLASPAGARANDVMVLLQQRSCPNCRLADADLVHADLRDADLQGAQLQRANLSQARLDGANLSGTDLSFTNLRGASLRGSDLSSSRLYGTDLRDADLTGARLSPKALEETHWQGAQGIRKGMRSHATIHNSGVEAFRAGRLSESEQLFSEAIRSNPDEPLSWVARGICRSEQAKDELAAADFRYAADIYSGQGADLWVTQLKAAADSINKRRFESTETKKGNGIGSQLMQGTMAGLTTLIPLAAKALIPLGLGL